MRIHRFEDVIAWQKARILTIEIYGSFKNMRDLGFKDQVFRATISIMNNIAEGFDRSSNRELRNFLNIARGSTAEVRSMLSVSVDLGYLDEEKQKYLLSLTDEISRLLSGFIKKLDLSIKNTRDKKLVTRDCS